MSHPFLNEEEHTRLLTFARLMKERGGLEASTDDGHILLNMAMCNVPKPVFEPDDDYHVIVFSDVDWSWLVVAYSQGGYSALRVKRSFMEQEFSPNGHFNASRAKRIFDGMLCILCVDPRNVQVNGISGEFGGIICSPN